MDSMLHILSTRYDDVYDKLKETYNTTVVSQESKTKQAEEAVILAEQELLQQASLERQYADELDALRKNLRGRRSLMATTARLTRQRRESHRQNCRS